MQLKASTQQFKAHAEAKRAGRIVDPAVIAEITAVAKRLRNVKSTDDVCPTPQRLAQGGVSLQPVLNPQGIQIARAYRSKGPLDTYRGKFPEDIENAFRVYRDAWLLVQRSEGVVNYDASPRSSGSRLGGLGNCRDQVRDANEMLDRIRDRLSPGSVVALDSFVAEILWAAGGRPPSLVEFARRIFPHFRDEHSLKCLGLGRIIGAGEELSMQLRIWYAISREPMRVVR